MTNANISFTLPKIVCLWLGFFVDMQVKLGITTRLISFSCFSLDVEISHISGRCGFCCQSLIWDWLRFSRVPRTSVAAHGLDLSWEFWEAIHAKMFFCETTYQNHYSKSYFSKIANYLLFSNHGIQQWKGKPPRESTLAISAEGWTSYESRQEERESSSSWLSQRLRWFRTGVLLLQCNAPLQEI